MKSEFKKSHDDIEFPVLMRFIGEPLHSRGSVVLFTGPDRGVCVHRVGDTFMSVGEFSDRLTPAYKDRSWARLKNCESIILSND